LTTAFSYDGTLAKMKMDPRRSEYPDRCARLRSRLALESAIAIGSGTAAIRPFI
jgi:trehalose-6-phosphatase